MKTLYYASDIARLLLDVVRALVLGEGGTRNWAEMVQTHTNDIGGREEATEESNNKPKVKF